MEKIPFVGMWARCWHGVPAEKTWVDEDGVTHVRDFAYRCRHVGYLSGIESGWESFDQDPNLGVYSGRAHFAFRGEVGGEPVTSVGHYTSECTRVDDTWLCSEQDLHHLSDGGLLKFSGTWEGGDINVSYSGVHVIPPRRP